MLLDMPFENKAELEFLIDLCLSKASQNMGGKKTWAKN